MRFLPRCCAKGKGSISVNVKTDRYFGAASTASRYDIESQSNPDSEIKPGVGIAIYFVWYFAGAFRVSRLWIVSCWDRSASLVVFISWVRCLYGSRSFSIAVWIRLNMTALPVAPFGMLANRELCDMVKGANPAPLCIHW